MDDNNGNKPSTPASDLVLVIGLANEVPCSACEELATNGPSRVATDSYRSGWDRIFGGREQSALN